MWLTLPVRMTSPWGWGSGPSTMRTRDPGTRSSMSSAWSSREQSECYCTCHVHVTACMWHAIACMWHECEYWMEWFGSTCKWKYLCMDVTVIHELVFILCKMIKFLHVKIVNLTLHMAHIRCEPKYKINANHSMQCCNTTTLYMYVNLAVVKRITTMANLKFLVIFSSAIV